jgi:hypothetical protein
MKLDDFLRSPRFRPCELASSDLPGRTLQSGHGNHARSRGSIVDAKQPSAIEGIICFFTRILFFAILCSQGESAFTAAELTGRRSFGPGRCHKSLSQSAPCAESGLPLALREAPFHHTSLIQLEVRGEKLILCGPARHHIVRSTRPIGSRKCRH